MKLFSRYDVPYELHEMDRARVELEYKNLSKYISEMFYDSKANFCSVVLEHGGELFIDDIRVVLRHHISQFDIDGDYADGKNYE